VGDAGPLTATLPRRIAVVNRGEAAVRLIRAERELNAEYDCGITTIALHTEAERRAMFARQADESVMLRKTSEGIAYLDHALLEHALLESRADAVGVGWGFVAEDIAFAELPARLGLTFIGPPAAAMRLLADKIEATSLRRIQLEYGAEIGRAVVNFDGPIVFCVISRYHGGAFVVFSNALNENMDVLAVEGSFSSVIGGAPAAAVVFTREVNARTAADPAVRELEAQLAASTHDPASASLRLKLAATRAAVRSDKLGEVAAEFEAVHTVERARQVGSVHAIIPAAELRPRIAEALECGMARAVGAIPTREPS
jgi:Biotin carboxylase, N-terminal domain/Carboxyl transferase domain